MDEIKIERNKQIVVELNKSIPVKGDKGDPGTTDYALLQNKPNLSLKADVNHNHNGVYEPANSNIQNHLTDTLNPHVVTKMQIGLGNCDNTSDLNKPISTAVQNALNTKEPSITKNTAFNQNFETSTSNIKTSGTVSVGSSDNIARADHVHPVIPTTALSDYVTSTWAPTDASGANLSLTINTTKYTKIGNLVFFTFSITYPTTSSTARAKIAGFPYPINRNGVTTAYTDASKTNVGLVISTSNFAWLQVLSPSSEIYNSDLSGKFVISSGFYFTS